MLVAASDRHRKHSPLAEIESSGLQPPFEHPGRAEAIRETLAADNSFELVEPDEWGLGPIEAVHEPGLVKFLKRAWDDYQMEHPNTHDVVPDLFAVPGLMDGMGDFPRSSVIDLELGRWCFETTTPLTEGSYDAARSAVDVA
jgi:acetoin utilization deacetylase AcuC-like enzyme